MEEKAKKALKNISYVSGIDIKLICKDSFVNIENALNQAEENEKALKIIAEKRVDIADLIHSKDANDYNDCRDRHWWFTQAEFNLVKKVVEKYGI